MLLRSCREAALKPDDALLLLVHQRAQFRQFSPEVIVGASAIILTDRYDGNGRRCRRHRPGERGLRRPGRHGGHRSLQLRQIDGVGVFHGRSDVHNAPLRAGPAHRDGVDHIGDRALAESHRLVPKCGGAVANRHRIGPKGLRIVSDRHRSGFQGRRSPAERDRCVIGRLAADAKCRAGLAERL